MAGPVYTVSAAWYDALMTGLDIERAKVLLRSAELSIAEVAERLGVPYRTFHRHFVARQGMTPQEWRQAEGVTQADGPSPLVSFRLPEFGELVEAADEAGETPSSHARTIVQKALRRRRKRG